MRRRLIAMGIVYAVGIGPGGREYYTEQAVQAIREAELVVGYSTYVELVKTFFPDKEYFQTPMRGEEERCRIALEKASERKIVAVVCSGDACVYGMASLLYELSGEYPGTEIRCVAGVTAALSGSAVLGAPLSNDFCVISLSDILTPWEEIEKRLHGAGAGDFAICLYNPGSRARTQQLRRACEILMRYKSPDTVCGYVRNIGRKGEEAKLLNLRDLAEMKADMFTTVFVGTRSTRIINGHMVTHRGYDYGI